MFPPAVTVSEGKLEGFVHTTSNGFQINVFLGIPYAKPPTGNLRFKDPQPPEKWTGTRDATVEGEINPQYNNEKKCCVGNEDSLFLNVSVPSTASFKSKLPVIFYIHGGGFYLGSGSFKSFSPNYLVEKDVILVTFNYRLGILGFMCLHTSEVPGNAGLKDQVFALRWIQKNIGFFGGDPQNVTIAGSSAGAACVHYHMMSPMSKGLFKRAIIQSGTCLCEWSKQKDPLMHAFTIAEKLGMKKTSNKDELLKFLRKVSIEDLTRESIIDFDYEMDIWFCGVVEQQFPDCESFLVQSPEELMQTGNYNSVPRIYGLTSHESVFLLPPRTLEAVENGTFEMSLEELKVLMKRHTMYDIAEDDLMAIKKFYFENDKNLIQGMIEFISDIYFTLGVAKTVNMSRVHSDNVFYYLYAFSGKLNRVKPTPLLPYDGAGHGDEENYLFKVVDDILLDPPDVLNRKRLVQIWANFVKCGNPTPETNDLITELWKPTTKDELNCFEINKDLKMFKDPFSARLRFMNSILCANMNDC